MKEKQYQYINAFNKLKYDRVTLMLPAGCREILKAAAASEGLSLNAYIISKLPENLISTMLQIKKGNEK